VLRQIGAHKQYDAIDDPVEFIKNVMEFLGKDQAEFGRLLQSRPRASEILNRRRPLTLSQIRQITIAWKIPAGPLIPNTKR
jgi:HTH-type transcriptional regulator/antitoxin HigA